MNQCTTLHALDRERIVLTSLKQLDSLYQAGNLAAYEQTWQEICQQVRHLFPAAIVSNIEAVQQALNITPCRKHTYTSLFPLRH